MTIREVPKQNAYSIIFSWLLGLHEATRNQISGSCQNWRLNYIEQGITHQTLKLPKEIREEFIPYVQTIITELRKKTPRKNLLTELEKKIKEISPQTRFVPRF